MRTELETLNTIVNDGYSVVIVKCFNPAAGVVYGSYVTKDNRGVVLTSGQRTRPDCLPGWNELLKKAERLATRLLH